MNLSENPLTAYILEEYYTKMAPPPELVEEAYEATLKPVTVRMSPEQIETVDNIAQYFGKTRREIMTNIIEGGISLVFDALAKSECLHSYPDWHNLSEEEKQPIIQQARLKFIKELCA